VVGLEQIGYSSLQDIAYERIREALHRGEFQPGESLPTRTLAKALGISTTPVREALARLVAQNVLEVDSVNGTAYVPPITRELLTEIYELRGMLEGLAAEYAAKNITRQELSQLDALWTKMTAKGLDFEQQHRISQEFQHTIYRAARRPMLLDLIRSVWLRSGLVLSLLAKSRPKGFTVEKHREKLLAALKRGDGKRARAVIQDAIDVTRDMLLSVIAK
jgi:GntR family colanic acid and biofilm gene transcriptional regulator